MKMRVKRTQNPQVMKNILETLKKASVHVGWQGDLALIAQIQEYGANLKGGQPFAVDKKGFMTFLRKDSVLGQRALRVKSGGSGNVKVKQKNRYNPKSKIVGLGVTKPSRIPARSLMLHTKENNSGVWKEFAAQLGKQVAEGKITLLASMNALGQWVRTDIQAEIGVGQSPRNTPLTAMRKGFNHPLKSNKNQLRREIRVVAEVHK